MRLNYGYPDQSCSSPHEPESDSWSAGAPVSSPYDPFTNCLTPRPRFLRYDPERCRQILQRLEESRDGFGGTSIGSNSEGSTSEDSAEQGQEDSDPDREANEVETPQLCSLRCICELLLLLLVLVLFVACICNRSISSAPRNFEEWHRSSSCTYEGVPEKIIEFVEVDVSGRSISSPSDEVGDPEGRRGNPSFTHEEAPEEMVELSESRRDAIRTDVDSSLGDIRDAAEWIEEDEVKKDSLRESYCYDELDETAEVRDGGVWKRVEQEPEESSEAAAETRVEKNNDVCEQENRCIGSNFYWIMKNSEPQGSGIVKPEGTSETENLLPEETHEVGEVASALRRIELATNAVYYGSVTAVLAFVLVYWRRKKNLANDSSPTRGHSFTFRAPPIKYPREFAEEPGREDHLASDPVSSLLLESSPSLGSFTTTEMISMKREDGNGEAWTNIATPVRRSRRIRDRAKRSQRYSMSSG